jgi:hypothetical protein
MAMRCLRESANRTNDQTSQAIKFCEPPMAMSPEQPTVDCLQHVCQAGSKTTVGLSTCSTNDLSGDLHNTVYIQGPLQHHTLVWQPPLSPYGGHGAGARHRLFEARTNHDIRPKRGRCSFFSSTVSALLRTNTVYQQYWRCYPCVSKDRQSIGTRASCLCNAACRLT